LEGCSVSEYNDDTLPRDLRDLAKMLLDNSVTGPILRDAGTTRDFTDEEEAAVIALARKAPFLARYDPVLSTLGNYAYYGNPWVAIGVARHVAAGDYTSVNDDQATHLIQINMVPCNEYWKRREGRGPDRFPGSEWQARKLAFDDYYMILKEVWALPETKESADNLDKVWTEFPDYLGDEFITARDRLELPFNKAVKRRGWTVKTRFWEVALRIFNENVDVNDAEGMREMLTVHVEANIDFGDEA
jgi:hypothetical protein